jgi:hypothetical protein
MTRRTSIVTAIAEKMQVQLNGITYPSNVYGNAFPKLKFWDEVNDFPCVYMSPGTEIRQYELSHFAWGLMNVSIKVYTRGEDSQMQLEQLLEDIENLLEDNKGLVYDTTKNLVTTEILVASITTDEGLLKPYAVGEINIQVRYQVMYA